MAQSGITFVEGSVSVFLPKPIRLLTLSVALAAGLAHIIDLLVAAVPLKVCGPRTFTRTIFLISPAGFADRHGLRTAGTAKFNRGVPGGLR
jgi:hypothetical protein